MPIGRVAGQAAYLQSHYYAGPAQTHLGNQALKTRTIGGRGPGLAKIIVDYNDLFLAPSELNRPLPQSVLAFGALGVFHDLPQCGLPYIQISIAPKML
jgi:hypothetical protein